MKTASLLALVVVLTVNAPASAAPAGGGLRTDFEAVPAQLAAPGGMLLVLHCELCAADSDPAVTFLYRRPAGVEARRIRGVRALDWAAGRFEIVDPAGNREVAGTPVEDGWAVEVPLPDGELPFRSQAVLRGFSARKGVYFPDQDLQLRNDFHFEPVASVLAANPAWDPQETSECEVVLGKDAALPVSFSVGGEPRAWLFPSLDESAAGEWTFQFARPGKSILERLEVTVLPADDGDSWTFRLPLDGVLSGAIPGKGAFREVAVQFPSDVGVSDGLRLTVQPRMEAAGAVRMDVQVENAIVMDLGDCPRIAR